MGQENRKTLQSRLGGRNATSNDYLDLIDSTVNKLDDGIDIDKANGLKLTLKGSSKKLLSFYQNMAYDPLWSMSLQAEQNNEGLNFSEGAKSRLFIQSGGRVGIGTTQPNYDLEVKGVVGMRGRVGTYAAGYIAATGQWKKIVGPVEGCHAFEVIAHINDDHDTRYALTYAIVLLSSGASGTKKKVIATDASSNWLWGKFLNKIQFRWELNEKETDSKSRPMFELQMRSRSHYGLKNGTHKTIFYRVTRLWDRSYEKADYNPMDLTVQPQMPQTRPTLQPPTQQPPVSRPNPTPQPGGKIKIKIGKK